MRVAGLEEIYTYISRWQNTVALHIATHLILDICLYTERIPGSCAPKRWW